MHNVHNVLTISKKIIALNIVCNAKLQKLIKVVNSLNFTKKKKVYNTSLYEIYVLDYTVPYQPLSSQDTSALILIFMLSMSTTLSSNRCQTLSNQDPSHQIHISMGPSTKFHLIQETETYVSNTIDIIDVMPKKSPEFADPPACFTRFPGPSHVCYEHQCSSNFNLGQIFPSRQ
jgi:hypothetical protein